MQSPGERLELEVLTRDSFKQWKKAIFRYNSQKKEATLHRTTTSEKPLACFRIPKYSLSLVGKDIGFVKKKKRPIFVQFQTESIAECVYEQLRPVSQDYSTDILIDAFTEAVVMVNEKASIIAVNDVLVSLFGYENKQELLGRNVAILMDDKIAAIHDKLMENYWKTGVRRLIGKSRLVRGKHKKGHLFPIVIVLGEVMEIVEGVQLKRVIGTIVPELDDVFKNSGDGSINSSSTVVSEEDWSEDDDDFILSSEDYVKVIDKLITYIEVYGSDLEGIFRLSGNFTESQELWNSIFVSAQHIDFSTINPHNLCDVLKRCLQERELITGIPYEELLEIAKNDLNSPELCSKAVTIFQILPEQTQQILGRLWLMFSHILSAKSRNKMTEQNLAIVTAPLLFRPSMDDMLVHIKLFGDLLEKLIIHNRVISYSLPHVNTFCLYNGPGKLNDQDWSILMTNSDIEEYSTGDSIVPDDGRNTKLYFLASGIVTIEKNRKPVSTVYSGEYIREMSVIGAGRSNAVIAKQPCKVIKLSKSFLIGLFESNHSIFYRFFWEQAKAVALRLKNLPLISAELDFDKKTPSGDESTKLEIHLPDGSSRWMGFSLKSTVHDITKELEKYYPKYSKKAYLTETSHGRENVRLKPVWTVQELLIRAKYACDYKIMYMSDEPIKRGTPILSEGESIVINQFSCKRKKKLGTFFILQSSILHVTKLFGLHSKITIFFSDIIKTRQDGVNLVIDIPGKSASFVFLSEDDCSDARRLISSLSQSMMLSPRDRKTSIEFVDQQWGLVLKRYKVLKPVLLVLKPGDLITILKTSPGEVHGLFKDHPIVIPNDFIEILSDGMNASPLMISETMEEDIFYPGLEQLPSKNNWATLLLRGQMLKFKKGETIVPQGSRIQRIFQIVTGFCRVQQSLSNAECEKLSKESKRWKESIFKEEGTEFSNLIVKTIGKGESFGEVSLFTGEGSIAEVVADGNGDDGDETTVFMIEAGNLAKLFEENPKIGARFSKYIHGTLLRRIDYELKNRAK